MPLLGRILKEGIKLRKFKAQPKLSPFTLQKTELLRLLTHAKDTDFGSTYDFEEVIRLIQTEPKNSRKFYEVYKKLVPTHNYNSMFKNWWHRAKAGESNVCWRGKVKYFALSSGTSEAASKYIPVTKNMLKAMRRTGLKQVLSLVNFPEMPSDVYEAGTLMLGGSTDLKYNGISYEGDLSGITTGQLPFWAQRFYKPGKKIAKNSDWNDKLHEIVLQAPKWDIGFVAGVPAWIQMLLEQIIAHYKVKNIHEIWPNLSIYAHGGVAFEPYKSSFDKLLARPLIYLETYLASEGFIAYQARPNATGESATMQIVLNNGIFHEFVPFNEQNFDENGEMRENPQTFMIDEIEENKDYAILLSTCAGAWRYLIGDTIRLVDKQRSEIIISGRTKHFLSLCGEHLSVDNMNRAVRSVSQELKIDINEFTVAGVSYENLFAHHWYIGTDDSVDAVVLKQKIDKKLEELNDDYRTERTAALKEIFVTVLADDVFAGWMRKKGKEGGQNKFPRVMKGKILEDWLQYLSELPTTSK